MKRTISLLDHLRWLTAWVVCLGHVRDVVMRDAPGHVVNFRSKLFYFATGYGHEGVVIFFVLSGFLVGEKVIGLASCYTTDGLKDYLAHRTGRIFCVLLPTLMVSWLIYTCLKISGFHVPILLGGWSSSTQISPMSNRIYDWPCHALLMNEVLCPTIPLDSPLWSLPYEWSYYIISAGLISAVLDKSAFGRIYSVYAGALFALILVFRPFILLAGLIWVCGMISGYISRTQVLSSKFGAALALFACLAALLYSRTHHTTTADVLLGIAFSLFLGCATTRKFHVAPKLGSALARFSYSLYCVHFCLLMFVVAYLQQEGFLKHRLPYGAGAVAIVFVIFFGCVAASFLFSLFTEANTRRAVSALRALFGISSDRPPQSKDAASPGLSPS